jgi:hypothetical protein
VELARSGAGQALSFDDLMNLVRQKASEQEILQKMRESSPRIALNADQIGKLRTAGAPAAVLAWLEKPPGVFRLAEVRVSRHPQATPPHIKLLVNEKDSVYKSKPETIEVGVSLAEYDERLVLKVDAPGSVEDGQSVRLRSIVRTDWEFRLKEPSTSLGFYVATLFKYQKQEFSRKAGTREVPINSGKYHLETESDITVPCIAGDATFGGDHSHRTFYVRAESGAAGNQIMLDVWFKYERAPDPVPGASEPAVARTDPAVGKTDPAVGSSANASKTNEPTGMILRAPHVTVPRGSSVLIPVELINAKDVLNLDFVLGYRPEIAMARRTAERGSLVTEIFQFNQNRPGEFKFNFAQLTPISGSGKVAGFRFDATGPGASRTPLSLSVHTVNDSHGRSLPITTIDGSISIYDPNNPNDPNHPNNPKLVTNNEPSQPTCSGSGRQTVNDAQCCLKMWVGLTTRSMHMDLDQSGEVDSRDAVIVLRNVQDSLQRSR